MSSIVTVKSLSEENIAKILSYVEINFDSLMTHEFI